MVKGSKRNKQMFSNEEIEIIKRLYPNTPNKVIATWMPHTSTSISNKAYAMGLGKQRSILQLIAEMYLLHNGQMSKQVA